MLSRVEERKPLGFVLDLAPGAGVEAAERLPADAAGVEPPGAGDGAVDEEGARPTGASSWRRSAPDALRGGHPSAARGRGARRPTWAGSAPAPASRGRGAAPVGRPGARRPTRRGNGAGPDAREPVRCLAASCPTTGRCRPAAPARMRPRYRRTSWSSAGAISTSSGPTQCSAVWKRCARRFSHVPEGGTRTSSTQGPASPQLRPTTSTSSSCRRGPSAISARSSSARRSRSASCGRGFWTRSHQSRCGARIATANGQ